jgi:hypothetical protein
MRKEKASIPKLGLEGCFSLVKEKKSEISGKRSPETFWGIKNQTFHLDD